MPGVAVPPRYSFGPVPSSNAASDVARPPTTCPTLVQFVPFHFATLVCGCPNGVNGAPQTYSASPVPSLNTTAPSSPNNELPGVTPPPTMDQCIPSQRPI